MEQPDGVYCKIGSWQFTVDGQQLTVKPKAPLYFYNGAFCIYTIAINHLNIFIGSTALTARAIGFFIFAKN